MTNTNIHSSLYLMHKYWGKKPSAELKCIIEKYTSEGQTILDPFCGYGGIGIESVLLNRNVILNDLNPVANYINECILNVDVDIKKLENMYDCLKQNFLREEKKWYSYGDSIIYTTLRDKNDIPIKHKIKKSDNKLYEVTLSKKEITDYLRFEKNTKNKYWYPIIKLIKNPRICVKDNTRIEDLFPKRALICHAFLYDLIEKFDDSIEKELLKFAFTSNIANCSKLVPPISSRGDMAQGAWMTGYYIGDTYLENNVFHYFENRVKKIIKGKNDYKNEVKSLAKCGNYKITNYDAKNIKLDSSSIDMVFTDFPYGDTVPYFEQSQLWNAWLKKEVDYNNEIVVSDSPIRNKNIKNFINDIDKSIQEISRLLKVGSYFVFTFHSINGSEWEALVKPLEKYNFEFVNCNSLIQKTFTPRQLNRSYSIKGDIEVVYKKIEKVKNCKVYSIDYIVNKCLIDNIKANELYETNTIINYLIKYILKYRHNEKNIDFLKILSDNFVKDGEYWRLR